MSSSREIKEISFYKQQKNNKKPPHGSVVEMKVVIYSCRSKYEKPIRDNWLMLLYDRLKKKTLT